MEEIKKRDFPVQRVRELYREEGIELSISQAEKILEFSKKLVNIVINQCITGGPPVQSITKHQQSP